MSCVARWPVRAIIVLSVIALSATPARAETDPGLIAGISLASFGAAGAAVGLVGSVAHLVHREPTGVWGWLSLGSGALLLSGGIVMSETDRDARGWASAAIALGVVTMLTGVVGLVLPHPDSYPPPVWAFAPVVGTTAGPHPVTLVGAVRAF